MLPREPLPKIMEAMARALSVSDIHDFLSRWAPPSLAEEWDNIGLQVGSMRGPVRAILVSLDVTEEAIWEAVEHKANLMVTHHPLFFKPITELTDRSLVMRLARLAAQTEMNILCFHTNLDSTTEGLNDLLAKRLKLKKVRPLLPSRVPLLPQAGLGRVGEIPATRLGVYLKGLAQNLGLKNFRFVGDPRHRIRKVAVMTGSGGAYYPEAKEARADLLITGDVKYHAALEALAEGVAVIDIGHYAGEIGMVPLVAGKLRQWLKRQRKRLPIFETQVASDPFQFYPPKK